MQRLVLRFLNKIGEQIDLLTYNMTAPALLPVPLCGITYKDIEYVIRYPKYVANQEFFDIVYDCVEI